MRSATVLGLGGGSRLERQTRQAESVVRAAVIVSVVVVLMLVIVWTLQRRLTRIRE
jgi:hypothetical protein